MARPPLRCWWDGVHVADIEAPKRQWNLRCRYTEESLDRWNVGAPLLSCALPLGSRPIDATNFFRGVLPEGRQLQAIADLAKVPTNHYFDLLRRFGRDIAGALVITDPDEGPEPRPGSVDPYSADDLDREIAALGDDNPLGLHADSELSIAGIQNKVLLVEGADGTWGRPVHGYPSTHILKVDHDGYPGLVRAEAQCLALAHALGLTNAPPQIETIGGRDCIIVTRYDRHRDAADQVTRTHQEDACQALDIDITANQNRGKYELAGGPSLEQVANLLTIHAVDAPVELERLVRLVTFTLAIGNADLHGKNISFLHDLDGRISLAPAYDTVPTMLWPKLRATSAVRVNGSIELATIDIDAIADEADSWGLNRDHARSVAADTVDATRSALPDVVTDADLAEAITGRTAVLVS
jgi:serine/threonine-protein kinase HipA